MKDFKFGYSDAIGTSFVPVSDLAASQAYQTSAGLVKVSSTDANDAAAGTGAQSVYISGLDSDYKMQGEQISLNGQTAVLSSLEYIRVFRAYVTAVGSGATAAGTIYVGDGTVTDGVPATKYAAIIVGENQTLMATTTTELGEDAYVTYLVVTGDTSKIVTCKFQVRDISNLASPGPWLTKNKFMIKEGVMEFNHRKVPMEFNAKTDLRVVAKVSTGTTEVSAGFEVWQRLGRLAD